MTWMAYFPEDGEGIEDAIRLCPPIWKRLQDAEDAAQFACEYEYHHRDGWDRDCDEGFPIVIVDGKGVETHWRGRHEPSIDHLVDAAEGK